MAPIALLHQNFDKENVTEDVPTFDYSRFEQDYKRLSLLGRGSFGEVWRCRNLHDGKEYAVKTVNFRSGATKRARHAERLALREVSVLRRMDHPNVMRFHQAWMERSPSSSPTDSASPTSDGEACLPEFTEDALQSSRSDWRPPAASDDESGILFADCEEEGGESWHEEGRQDGTDAQVGSGVRQKEDAAEEVALHIAIELCREGNLHSWIANRNATCKGKNLGEEPRFLQAHTGLSIFIQCVRALSHLHEHSCVHRDLKPANILFAPDGRVRLGDFGLAKIVEAEENEAGAPHRKATWCAEDATKNVGTPSYAGPEQLSGQALGPSADVFSMGVVLLELLCPFQTHMERASVLEDLREQREVPAAATATSPTLAKLVMSMTEPDQSKRPTPCDILRIAQQAYSEVRRRAPAASTKTKAAIQEEADAKSTAKPAGRRKGMRGIGMWRGRRRSLHRGFGFNSKRAAAVQKFAEIFRAKKQERQRGQKLQIRKSLL